ncbi:ribosome small subunit-dependent GTPase A [Pillotina sp. SPG140]|jgi:ribosome biogenesis GTPase
MKGLVVRGSHNIFSVYAEGQTVECRIKGKILKELPGYYNPLAPGDIVECVLNVQSPQYGFITAVEERKTVFSRHNQNMIQLIACNIDIVLCVTTLNAPPFRPRFLDRLLIQADSAAIPVAIIVNKSDLSLEEQAIEERLNDFTRLGYTVLKISAKTGSGITALKQLIHGHVCALIGQSGVGKSSIVRILNPNIKVRVGSLNDKYDRGNHTTVMAELLEADEQTRIIDTPGIRTFIPTVPPKDSIYYFREFAPLEGTCTYGVSCSHRNEKGCAILQAVQYGTIHRDRYESFIRLRDGQQE